MHYFWWLLLFCSLPLRLSSADAVATAERYLFVREERWNDSREIRMFLRSVGVYHPAPWCAGFVRYVLDEAGITFPIRSAWARSYKTKKSIPAKWVAKGYHRVERNWLAVWKRGEYGGHIGFVIAWDKNSGQTIEGNVSGRGGQGVHRKKREIYSSQDFHVKWFTPL